MPHLLIVASLIAIIVWPIILWLHGSVHVSRSLAVILVYLIMGILVPLALMLAMPAMMENGIYRSYRLAGP